MIERYKSGFEPPGDIPFEDLNRVDGNHHPMAINPIPVAIVKPEPITVKGTMSASKLKKRGVLFGIFSSNKVRSQLTLSGFILYLEYSLTTLSICISFSLFSILINCPITSFILTYNLGASINVILFFKLPNLKLRNCILYISALWCGINMFYLYIFTLFIFIVFTLFIF